VKLEHHVTDHRALKTGRVALELRDEEHHPGWAVARPARFHVHHVGDRQFTIPMGTLAMFAEAWERRHPEWVRETNDGNKVILLVPLADFERAFRFNPALP
jgi:hypothetical protein